MLDVWVAIRTACDYLFTVILESSRERLLAWEENTCHTSFTCSIYGLTVLLKSVLMYVTCTRGSEHRWCARVLVVLKKKAWNTRKFRWWGVQCTYPNSIRTKYVIFTVNSLQILTPTHPPPLSLTFPRRFRSVKSERCSCKILSKDYNLKLCNYTTKRIRQKSVGVADLNDLYPWWSQNIPWSSRTNLWNLWKIWSSINNYRHIA